MKTHSIFSEETTIRKQIETLFEASNWSRNEMYVEPKISLVDGQKLLPDLILSYHLYPLAVIEMVRPSSSQRYHGKEEQVRKYAKALDIPFAFVTDGQSHRKLNLRTDLPSIALSEIPSPQSLLEEIGHSSYTNDPFIFPPFNPNHQAFSVQVSQAVTKAIDAIVSQKSRVWLQMAQGTGKAMVELQVLWKLLHTSKTGNVLIIGDRINYILEQQKLLEPLRQIANFCVLGEQPIPTACPSIVFGMRSNFYTTIDSNEKQFLPNPDSPGFYDLIIVNSVANVETWKDLFVFYTNASVVTLTDYFPSANGKALLNEFQEPVYTYSHQMALENEALEPPTGFRSVRLGDVAELRTGAHIRQSRQSDDEKQAHTQTSTQVLYRLSWKSIQPDGTINLSLAEGTTFPDEQAERIQQRSGLLPNDIILPRILGYQGVKVGIVSSEVPKEYFIDQNLIRVRVNPKLTNPQEVYDYLRSDRGEITLRRFASQTSQPLINIAVLEEIPIFIPEQQNVDYNPSRELSAVAKVIQEIENNVLPLLRKADNDDKKSNNETLLTVAAYLRDISKSLAPPTLEEKVLERYPTPLAIPYGRFLNARFNVYEQVLRLIDVVEATQFFVYNVLLMDVLHRPQDFYIDNAGARRAFNGYSMSARMDFVREVQTIAKQNHLSLFVEELTNSFDVDKASQLTATLRNQFAHTATAPEGQQNNILRTFTPQLDVMLEQLDFLQGYRLVRIPSFHFEGKSLIRQLHVYRGTTPFPEQEEITKGRMVEAERAHLILLSPDDRALDLHPCYQLVASPETRHETHIGFLKQRKQKQTLLEGESVEGVFALNLDGFHEFEKLQSQLLDKPKS